MGFEAVRQLTGLPRRQCAPRVRLFQAIVTTDKTLRTHNQDRLRQHLATATATP
ncbi:MAG TPA: hypothetical protein VGH27_36095 [Streptosporangiaceae bacterium]